MATIKFESNLLQLPNIPSPWVFNPSYFEGVPISPGVYIVGVKIPVNGQGEKFCPLYVGIMKDLSVKIKGHWDINNKFTASGELNSFKEIFDIANFGIKDIYTDMRVYNATKRKKGSLLDFYLKISCFKSSLIWFNDSSFFDVKLNLNSGTSKYNSGNGHIDSIKIGGDLDSIGTIQSKELKGKINKVKELYTHKYYYAYCTLDNIFEEIIRESNHPLYKTAVTYKKTKEYKIGRKNGPGKIICENIEGELKKKLFNIGICTTAKGNQRTAPFNFDLSPIQLELVNISNWDETKDLII